MQEATQGRPSNPFKLTIVILLVLLGLTAASWPLIKTYRESVRFQELLGEFVQVSDDFTRPKFYIHRSFYKKDPVDKPKTFIYRLGAYSDGRVNLPEIPANHRSEKREVFGRGYDVIMNLEDRLFRLERDKTSKEYSATLGELLEWADEVGGPQTMKLLCRIKKSGYHDENVIEGDFMLIGEELDAFLKTLELSRMFKEADERNGSR